MKKNYMTTDVIKTAVDCTSIGATIAVLMNYLPVATAILTFLWTVLRLYETKAVQDLISRWRK